MARVQETNSAQEAIPPLFADVSKPARLIMPIFSISILPGHTIPISRILAICAYLRNRTSYPAHVPYQITYQISYHPILSFPLPLALSFVSSHVGQPKDLICLSLCTTKPF